MSVAEAIKRCIDERATVHPSGSEWAVVTQCLYPSSGNVTVYVSGGRERCIVTDHGEALHVARTHGIDVKQETHKWMAQFCAPWGLKVSDGAIMSPSVPFDAAWQAIVFTANASARVASYAVHELGAQEGKKFESRVEDNLRLMYGRNRISKETFLGFSNRSYAFDHVVHLPEARTLIVDTVTPHHVSVNAKAVAHFDIARSESGLSQAIVFDRSQNWQSSDINLLQSAAQLVPLDRMKDMLPQVSAH